MNGWRPAAFAAMSCASLACGGKLADDTDAPGDAAMDATADVGLGWTETGPPTADAQPPPPSTTCSFTAPEVATDTNGKCSTTETWTCDGSFYEIECNCWSQTCACYGNGDVMLTFGFQGCPSCTLGSDAISKCPFPH